MLCDLYDLPERITNFLKIAFALWALGYIRNVEDWLGSIRQYCQIIIYCHLNIMKQKKKSPIKDKPLRYAGQSLDEKIDSLVIDKAFPYFIACSMVFFWAMYEWIRYFRNPPPQPIPITLLATAVVLFSI